MASGRVSQKIDLGYRPRRWQHEAAQEMRGKRYACIITSRQIGKTVLAISTLISRALAGPANSTCCYCAPHQTQARRIAWPELKNRLRPLGERVTFNESQLCATLPGDRKIYVLGASDGGDHIRGSSFHTLIVDERDSISDEVWTDVLLPTLNRWGESSFVVFIGTLAGGASALWQMFVEHKDDPEWACIKVPASESGCFTEAWLAEQRRLMGEAAYLRELEADPRAPVAHSVIGRDIDEAQRDGRIRPVPYRLGAEVHTSWDIGVRDFTSVWCYMLHGRWIEVLAYREYSGIGLIDCAHRLIDEHPNWRWGEAALPHDARNRDKNTAVSVETALWEIFSDRGGICYTQPSAPNPMATLQSTRANLPRCVFDEDECDHGLIRLKSARFEVDQRTSTVLDRIRHDDHSHALDAFRLGMYRLESLHPAAGAADEHLDYQRFNSGANDLTPDARYFE